MKFLTQVMRADVRATATDDDGSATGPGPRRRRFELRLLQSVLRLLRSPLPLRNVLRLDDRGKRHGRRSFWTFGDTSSLWVVANDASVLVRCTTSLYNVFQSSTFGPIEEQECGQRSERTMRRVRWPSQICMC